MCSRGSIHFSKQDRRSCAPRQPRGNAASGSRLELFETDLKVGQYQDHDSIVAERVVESVTLRTALTLPATSLRMKLTFLGTRGEIEARTRRHRMHTSLLVSYRGAREMSDCGLDWLGKLKRVAPNAIVLTHAHPDHAWGLKRGAPCPVYAPESTWQELQR